MVETDSAGEKKLQKKSTISAEEYRKILGDNLSSEEQIRKRVGYLESLCRNIIRGEIEKFLKATIN